jgi:aryl-alcohol dehydrogenase-like predicted oxidoreductase
MTMRYRPLGRTGIDVSEIAFGCGPVPALLTGTAAREQQLRTIARAVELGINWFDTAATYGDGRSEENLGWALEEFGLSEKVSGTLGSVPDTVHVATKVRMFPEDLRDIRGAVLRSVEGSLQRLRTPAVTLLQLHNSITQQRGAQPTSITPNDVLGGQGVLSAFDELQRAGTVRHLGLTGLGEPAALIDVLQSERFATVQAPYNLLHQSAGSNVPEDPPEHDLRGLFAACQRLDIGVFAIRVFAGGALAGRPPSAHTLTTKFFPLDLYQRDLARAAELHSRLPTGQTLTAVALQFALGHPAVSSAIVGCGSPEEVEQAVAFAAEAQG